MPFGKVFVIVSGELIVIEAAAVAVAPTESFTCTVEFAVTLAVGIPEITPVVEEIVIPAGSDPDTTLHEYGVNPPAATREVEYATPTVPSGCGPPVKLSGETMVIEAAAVAVALVLSSTCTVKFEAPCAVGVPVIKPVVGDIVSPAGKDPEAILHL